MDSLDNEKNEIEEFYEVFFQEDILAISELMNYLLSSYRYNYTTKKFEFCYTSFKRFNVDLNEDQKTLFSSTSDIYKIIYDLHNRLADKARKNLNIGKFMDWVFSIMKRGFYQQSNINMDTKNLLVQLMPEVNENLYQQYTKTYKSILTKMINESRDSCNKAVKKRILELKIHKIDDETLFYKLEENNKDRIFYINFLSEILKVDKDELYDITYEVKNRCEFEYIISAVEGSLWIKDLPKKDPNHESRNTKGKLDNAKNRMIKILNELGMRYEASLVEKKINYKKTINSKAKYEDQKKTQKEILLDTLIKFSKTSNTRAKKIIKILDFI